MLAKEQLLKKIRLLHKVQIKNNKGKKMIKMILNLGVVFVLATGCTHAIMRGSVVMKSKNQAHVCLGDNEVRKGDRVTFYENKCEHDSVAGDTDRGGGGHVMVNCTKKLLGQGTVVRLINTHFSTVVADKGVKFSEGTTVEKRR